MAKSRKKLTYKKSIPRADKCGVEISHIQKVVLAAFTLLLLVFLAFIIFLSDSGSLACTAEAKLCPDGSYVGRTGPSCEFADCPLDYCSSFSYSDCPSECAICPPCEVCSSISCRSEQFCNSIGFNRSWWENVRPDK